MINIFQNRSVDIRSTVQPDLSSQEERGIMDKNIVSLSFKHFDYIDFQRGDYATIFSELYKLNKLPVPRKIANREFEYQLTLEGETQDLGKVQYRFLDQNNNFTEGVFDLKDKAEGFLRLIIYNLQRVYPDAGWHIGSVIESDYQLLSFENTNCLEALNRLAEVFKTEFLIEGKRISLYRRQIASGITLKYGKGEALLSITRQNQDNANRITRLYAYGSDKNIGNNYRNGARRLRMSDSLYVEKGIDEYEIIEDTVIFEDIFPHRNGIVTSVTDPFNFSDNSIDFNLNNYILPEPTKPKLTFNTGQLSGYTFEVSGYNNITKTITILKNTEEQTIDVPSVIFSPAIGDKYVLTDIMMPDQYIINAEAELKSRAIEELNVRYSDKPAFSVVCNAKWFKANEKVVKIGQVVQLDIPEMSINKEIRIIGYTRNLRSPNVYTMQLADTVKQTTIVKLINGI